MDVIANKAAYPVPLAGAAKRFASIVALAHETPAPEVTLMVGSGPGVSRMEVGYAEDAAGKMTFSHVLILLLPTPPDDVPALHVELTSALRKKLGKPKFTKKGEDPLPQMGWKLSGPIELWMGEETSTIPGSSGQERHIRISIGAPSGEGD